MLVLVWEMADRNRTLEQHLLLSIDMFLYPI